MRVVRGLPVGEPRLRGRPAVVSIGSFDGVHRGHLALLRRLAEVASEAAGELAGEGGLRVVVTFDPHPRCVLTPDRCPATLTPLPQRLRLLDRAGVEEAIVCPFTQATRRWSAAEFCQRLSAAHRISALVVGEDFAMGRDRQGDVDFLRSYGAEHDFAVHTVAPLIDAGAAVSSSRVRAAVAAGDLAEAARLMGRRWALEGSLVEVDAADGAGEVWQRIDLPSGLALPPEGSYLCEASPGEGDSEAVGDRRSRRAWLLLPADGSARARLLDDADAATTLAGESLTLTPLVGPDASDMPASRASSASSR